MDTKFCVKPSPVRVVKVLGMESRRDISVCETFGSMYLHFLDFGTRWDMWPHFTTGKEPPVPGSHSDRLGQSKKLTIS
jgi:hypothetical protein